MAKEVAKAEEKTQAVGNYDYGDAKHEGFEGVKVTDLSIPFISVMQSNSVLVEDEDNNIKSGDLVNSVTGEVVQQPFIVQPIHKDHLWAEWVPRTKGGGRGDSHEDGSAIVLAVLKKNGGSRIPPEDADGKRMPFKTPEGMDLIETHYVYCLILDETGTETVGYCVLPFSSTKIKVQKDWWTSMYTIKGAPPLMANRAKVSTTKQTAKGKSFFNLLIRPFGDTWISSLIKPDEAGMLMLTAAREFREMIEGGLAKAATETEGKVTDQGSGDSSSGSGSGADTDDDMPF
jgi:hypothetical protein